MEETLHLQNLMFALFGHAMHHTLYDGLSIFGKIDPLVFYILVVAKVVLLSIVHLPHILKYLPSTNMFI